MSLLNHLLAHEADLMLADYMLDLYDNMLLNEVLQESMDSDEELKRQDKVSVIMEKVKYKEEEPVECEICFDDIKKDDYTCNLDCNHKFHFDCLYEWMHYKMDCPVCRNNIT